MTNAAITKTSFTSGELDPLLHGRLDLRAQDDGAARLRNVVVHPTGGISRRPGLRLVGMLPGAVALVSFDGTDGGELLAFGSHRLDVVKAGVTVATLATVWNAAQARDLSTARWANRLLVCHPDVPPQELVRVTATRWELHAWRYETTLGGKDYGCEHQPFAKFAAPETALQINGGTAQPLTVANNPLVTLEAGEPVFTDRHGGTIVRYKGRDIRILSWDPLRPNRANGVLLQDLPDGLPTRDWAEQAFSEAHGWPACIAVHQERLVIGGSRDLPDRLWFSRTGHPLNFDLGEGLPDEAISFRLAAEERHEIRSIHAGRQLQLFTSRGEWIVRGSPVTPESVEVELQTRVGSWTGRRLTPVNVDGATLFVGTSGRELREFLFTDTEQAYQAADIALLSRHLLDNPAGLAFDRRRRWLLVVRADGALATVSIDRNSNVVAWSLLESSGVVRAATLHAGEPHFLVELGGQVLLERFDETVMSDHTVERQATSARTSWSGLMHLNGHAVVAVAKDGRIMRGTVSGGTLTLPQEATHVLIGTPFAHEVEPLPLTIPSRSGPSLDQPYRPVRVIFHLLETGALQADVGSGLRRLELYMDTVGRFSGDASIRALGWRRGRRQPPWRVRQDEPLPCTILAVTTEIKGND